MLSGQECMFIRTIGSDRCSRTPFANALKRSCSLITVLALIIVFSHGPSGLGIPRLNVDGFGRRLVKTSTHSKARDACVDDPSWRDTKYGDGTTHCPRLKKAHKDWCFGLGAYSKEARRACPEACGLSNISTSECYVPHTLSYKRIPSTEPKDFLSKEVKFVPTHAFPADTSFTIDPALPMFFKLHPHNGEISGFYTKQEVCNPIVEYLVTATHSSGKAKCNVTLLTHSLKKLGGFRYPSKGVHVFSPGQKVKLEPEHLYSLRAKHGKHRTGFGIEPPLFQGLKINGTTGEIHGVIGKGEKPKMQRFVVTGEDYCGKLTAAITLSVQSNGSLYYPGLPGNYSLGDKLKLVPNYDGESVRNFVISPALPESFHFDSHTGEIQGVIGRSQLCHPVQKYVVIAVSPSANVTREITLLVKTMSAPKFLHYPDVPTHFSRGDKVELVPRYTGGHPSVFTVEPALPKGLELHRSTGEIHGHIDVSEKSVQLKFVVTVKNHCGNITTHVLLSVQNPVKKEEKKKTPGKNKSLTYPGLPGNFSFRSHLKVTPTFAHDGATTFSINPVFPNGLELDSRTGTIQGAFGKEVLCKPIVTYTVTAKSSAGNTTCNITLQQHRFHKPKAFHYQSERVHAYSPGQKVKLVPSFSGEHPSAFTVKPALFEGLHLNTTTGEIHGVIGAGVKNINRKFVVTGEHQCGQIETTITLTVRTPLQYPRPKKAQLGDKVSISPVGDHPHFSNFSIRPNLPGNLSLDTESGEIQGVLGRAQLCHTVHSKYVVTAASKSDTYTVEVFLFEKDTMATNVCGNKSALLNSLGFLGMGEDELANSLGYPWNMVFAFLILLIVFSICITCTVCFSARSNNKKGYQPVPPSSTTTTAMSSPVQASPSMQLQSPRTVSAQE